MPKTHSLLQQLGIPLPLFLAPMAGGPSTPELCAAVSNAGGLGSLGEGYSSPEKIREQIRRVRALTTKPFAMNLFISEWAPRPDDRSFEEMKSFLQTYRTELGLPPFHSIDSDFESQDQQMRVLLDEKVPVFTFTFGMPSGHWIQKFKSAGIFMVGTATNLEEGIALEKAGIDAVCGQGAEAGGHRGTFIGEASESLISTVVLTRQLSEKLSIPVIAAGGIMNGQAMREVLKSGAQAAQLGTAFLLCPEAGSNPAYRKTLKSDQVSATEITKAFSGREARGIVNRMVREMRSIDVLPYPYQNNLTRELRTVAAKAGRSEFLSMWAGQGARLIREVSANLLVETLMKEMNE